MTNLPLKGVRIVDIAHAWAGPHALESSPILELK